MADREGETHMEDSRARRKIRVAVEAKGHEVEDMDYEPIGGMVEAQGRSGGWVVWLKDAEVITGFSWRDVVEWAEKYLEPKEAARG